MSEIPQELGSVLPERAWELGPGSGWGWWRSLLGQPPSRLVPVNSSGPAWMLGQGSPFARQVSQPHPGSGGAGLAFAGTGEISEGCVPVCWSGPGTVFWLAGVVLVGVPSCAVCVSLGGCDVPCAGVGSGVWFVGVGLALSGVGDAVGVLPLPAARRWGLSSGLSERSCLGHLPVRPASGSKTVEPQASGRLFDRSRGPGLLLAGRVPWS